MHDDTDGSELHALLQKLIMSASLVQLRLSEPHDLTEEEIWLWREDIWRQIGNLEALQFDLTTSLRSNRMH